jgi:hypothetical protein
LLLKGLVERENDYALIISLDSVNSLAFVEAYTPIPSSDSFTLSHIYLSTCDFPDTESSTFSNAIHTPADLTTSASKRLAPYTDLFLSTKKKYKPVAKKVCPVLGELPEKFWIEHKIIGNPLDACWYSIRTHRHSNPPITTPSSDEINSTRTILAASCGQQRETLCTTSC